MSLGTIHSNLYKPIAKEGRTQAKNLNVSLFLLSFLVVSSFMVYAAWAAHTPNVTLSDSYPYPNGDRIVQTGQTGIVLTFNVSNAPASANSITMINITNASVSTSGFNISSAAASGGGSCTVTKTGVNCTGFSVAANSHAHINVTTNTPSIGNDGPGNFTVDTTDNAGTPATTVTRVGVLALGVGDMGFEITDELGTSLTGALVRVVNTSGFKLANTALVGLEKSDADDLDGLVWFDHSTDIVGSSDGLLIYNVSRSGYINVSAASVTYYFDTSPRYTAIEPSGSPFGIKITVQDELGNVLTGAVVNATDLPLTAFAGGEGGMGEQSVTANQTVNGVHYFALKSGFNNVTFLVTRDGFINHSQATLNNVTSVTYPVNTTAQAIGASPYKLNYKLKVNLTDELQTNSSFGTGVGFLINDTNATSNQSQNNIYYFSIPHLTAVSVNTSRAGYVNNSVDNLVVNTSTQAVFNPQMLFRYKVIVRDELGGVEPFSTGVTIAINGTSSTSNSSSANVHYFNVTSSALAFNISRAGYINSTNNSAIQSSAVSQGVAIAGLNFSIRVTDICNEIAGITAGNCYNIDGTTASANISDTVSGGTMNTTFSGGDAYINATTGVSTVTVRINASKNGFVDSTLLVRVNQTTQARIVFNATDGTASATDRGSALPFTIKVLAVFDELGQRNFTLNNTQSWGQQAPGAGVDILTQANNVFYDGPSAYVNATGQAAVQLSAFVGNQTLANTSIGVTPNNIIQQTVIFNHTNQPSATVAAGGLRYIFNLTVGDELTRSTNFDSGVTISFNNTAVTADKTANSGSGWSYYFSNTSLPTTLSVMPNVTFINVSRSGYINTSGVDNLHFNATNGTSRTFTMNFNVKVAVNDELSSAFTASDISFAANNSAVSQPNATSGVFAYFALPPSNDTSATGGYFINASRVGYVDNATSRTTLFGVNSTRQQLQNITLLFTLKVPVRGLCDQLNVTCLTIDGSQTTFGSGGVQVSGIGIGLTNFTTYSGGEAYINATNGTTISLVAFGNGYVNRTATGVTPNAINQTFIVFNQTNTTDVPFVNFVAFRYVNASGLLFPIRIVSVCDEVSVGCLNINGSRRQIGSAASEINDNTTRYADGRGYIAVRGTGPGQSAPTVAINASAEGYVNVTNSSVTPSGSSQVDVIFNSSTTPIKFSTKITLNNELAQTTGMGTGVTVRINETDSIENRSYFRSSPTSNVFYINSTIPGVNVSFKKDGYINQSQNNMLANASVQGVQTFSMPFAVKITTTDQSGSIYVGATVQIRDGSSNTFTIVDGNATMDTLVNSISGANASGHVGDTNTSSDGYIYLAINQSNITNNVDVTILPNRNGYSNAFFAGRQINYSNQLAFSTGNTKDDKVPAAATSVTATIVTNNATSREVSVTWTASTSNDVSHYRVYRNNTQLGTSATTSFVDNPNVGIFYYNVTTVDTAGNLATTNGTTLSTTVFLGELVAPTITITAPADGANFTSQTPTITFTVEDNSGGVGADITTIAVNITGSPAFSSAGNCTTSNDAAKYTCSYVASTLTDGANHTLSVAAKDKYGNTAANASRSFGVDIRDGVTAALNTSDTSAIADNTYANGWSFTFNITLGGIGGNATDVNATAVKVANWTQVGGSGTIPTTGNTIMEYTISNGTAATYYVSHNYNTTDTIYPLKDEHLQSKQINGTVTIKMKLPASTTPGTYTTTFTFGSWSIALTGGNPT